MSANKEADFIIVGGGCAGSVVAARLSEDPDCSVPPATASFRC